MMASVYLPWVKYRSTCDALDSAMTAIAKPLSMTFAFEKEGFERVSEFAAAVRDLPAMAGYCQER